MENIKNSFIVSKKEIIQSQGVKSFVAISNISEDVDLYISKMEVSVASDALVDLVPIFITDINESLRQDLKISSSRIGDEVNLRDTVKTYGSFALISKATPLKSYVLSKGNTVVLDPLDNVIIPPFTALVIRVITTTNSISVTANTNFHLITKDNNEKDN